MRFHSPDLNDVYTISASQGGRTRSVSLEAGEWNLMALVDGYRSVNDILKYSAVEPDIALKKLAQLKLAGIITKTERKEIPGKPAANVNIDKMVNRLANLFEDYLTDKNRGKPIERKITRTVLEETEN